MSRLHLGATITALLATTAYADDEGSDHSARLAGDPADTLGITLDFAGEAGWSLAYRRRPGAEVEVLALPFLGRGHAHHDVWVSPARALVTFVLTMAGRGAIGHATEVIWVVEPGTGRLVRTFSVAQVYAPRGVPALGASVDHAWWSDPARTSRPAGPVIVVPLIGGEAVVLDPIAAELRRRVPDGGETPCK